MTIVLHAPRPNLRWSLDVVCCCEAGLGRSFHRGRSFLFALIAPSLSPGHQPPFVSRTIKRALGSRPHSRIKHFSSPRLKLAFSFPFPSIFATNKSRSRSQRQPSPFTLDKTLITPPKNRGINDPRCLHVATSYGEGVVTVLCCPALHSVLARFAAIHSPWWAVSAVSSIALLPAKAPASLTCRSSLPPQQVARQADPLLAYGSSLPTIAS